MEEEIQRLKHENAYLHRQIQEMWSNASDYAFDHIEEHTRENAFLDYNVCSNRECSKNVDWFSKIYYCCSECEKEGEDYARRKREEIRQQKEAAEAIRAAQAENRRKIEEIRQQKAAEERQRILEKRKAEDIPNGISIEAYNTATQFGLQIAKKRRKH